MTRWVVAVLAGEERESVLETWTTSTDQVLVVRTTDAVDAATSLAALPNTHVFLVARPARHALLHQTGSLLSALRPDVAVVRFATHAPTLTAAAVATTIAPLGLDPNAAATLLEQALAGAHSGAWVPKVTGLEFPQPTVGQHLGGLFSRDGFIAALTPTPAVTRPADVAPSPLGDHVLLSGPNLPAAALHALQQAYRVGAHVTVPAIGVGREEYGANGVEFVLLPPAERLHPGPALGTCRECGLPLYGTPRCPTCRVMHQPSARSAVAAPVAGRVPAPAAVVAPAQAPAPARVPAPAPAPRPAHLPAAVPSVPSVPRSAAAPRSTAAPRPSTTARSAAAPRPPAPRSAAAPRPSAARPRIATPSAPLAVVNVSQGANQ